MKILTSVFTCWFIASLAITSSACSAENGRDDWLHFRTVAEISSGHWEEVSPSRIHRIIAGEAKSQALLLLATESAHRIDVAEAKNFIGEGVALSRGQEFILLRGVRAASDNQAVSVLTDGSRAVVSFVSLTKKSGLQREPVIVELPKLPEQVYVEVSTAE